jgi:hypothetical protein
MDRIQYTLSENISDGRMMDGFGDDRIWTIS